MVLRDLVRADTNLDYLWEKAALAATEGRWAELQDAYDAALHQLEISQVHADAGDREAAIWASTFEEQAHELGAFLGIVPAYGPDPEAEAERRYFDLADPAYVADLRRDDWAFDDYDV
jgi:hypothetical protein